MRMWRNLWAALGVLVVGIIITVLASLYIKVAVESAAQREFDFVCNEIRLNINARLEAAAQILRGGTALFDAVASVSRGAWRTFTRRLKLDKYLPGIQGIGFALLIPSGQLDQHVQVIRGEGFPDYQVRPAGERETYSAIIYLEPFEGRNLRAFGYDMLSEPVRRAAMERARDANAAALSGKVILVQETGQDVQAGVLMYVPVYRHGFPIETLEQRRAALQGWVYSPYRMTDLMRGTLGHWDVKQNGRRISMQIFDGDALSADTLLYDSHDAMDREPASTAPTTRLIPVDFAGHRWTLRFTAPGGILPLADYGIVWLFLFGGTTGTFFVFGLMLWRQQRIRFYRDKAEAGEALIASEERFRVAAENLTDIVYDWDIKEEKIDWYGDIDGITGYPPGGFPRTISAWAAALQPEDKDRVMVVLEAHLKGVAPYNVEYRVRKRNGETRWWSARGSALRDDRGEPYKMIGSITDITERKRAEESLQNAEERYRALFERSADGILIAELETRMFKFANPAICRMLGYTENELKTLGVSSIHPTDDLPRVVAEFEAQTRGEKVLGMDIPCLRKDGTIFHADINSAITSIDGRLSIFGIFHDVTERKRMEEERLILLAGLQQQKKLAAMGTLARGMAHEINNPIMGVMNYAQLIKDMAAGNASLLEFADEIIAEIRRVAKMTHCLLRFAHQQDTQPFTPTRGADVVASVLPLAEKAARARGIVLSSDIPPDLPVVSCHQGQLGQVVMALLTNAVEAMEERSTDPGLGTGRPRPDGSDKRAPDAIHLTARQLDKAGRAWLRLTVEDNGPGIPGEIRERLFDPFFTTKDRTKHSGLGLWISRSIAQEHGGELTCESPSTVLRAGETGRGTRVHVDIPVVPGSGPSGPLGTVKSIYETL